MTWTCRPGAWFAVLGEHAVVVLPPSEKARVAAVWELVDDGAGFDETLDALITSGLRDLPGFVLVSREGEETRVVLRGEAHAHFATVDGVVRVDGEQATTWVERTLTGVTRIRVQVADDEHDDEHADQHDWHDDWHDDTLRVVAGLLRISSAEWGDPVDPPPTVAVRAATDHDGLTQTGADRPARPLPGIPGQPPAPPVTAQPVAHLVFSSGDTVAVDRAVVVGRAPEVRSSDGEEPLLVRVPSPYQEISATHLEVRPGAGADHGTAVVTDLGSTNGTLLIQPGLPPEDLRAGVAAQLLPGAVIDLGDGVTIEVLGP